MQRSHNEDSIFSINASMTSDLNNLPFGLFIVADGMGGHQHGEIASSIAVRALSGYVINKLCPPIFSYQSSSPDQTIQEIMSQGILDAHRMILKELQGGGTTLSAILLRGGQMTIAHVGDSRAYSISATGEVKLLTRDHSLVRRLIELGQITEEEATSHPQRNVLYRALGQGEPFEPDVSTYSLPKGGYLLICSDGLWGVIPDDVLAEITLNAPSVQDACQQMIDAANKAGGPDNISVILVHLPD
ncbi:MAG TPA: PP2C family serine/threonine-protein phosphatase [Anaerolineales bacterium]|nr:PP2C family serine/threonine-protein phosphatase [Anaerolineales bacterium]